MTQRQESHGQVAHGGVLPGLWLRPKPPAREFSLFPFHPARAPIGDLQHPCLGRDDRLRTAHRSAGRRRIDIAREVLIAAIRDTLPAGTSTALRVFGHQTPNACKTDLEIPLGSLDPDAAIATLTGITAKNLARTPIAASLAAVPGDLGDAADTSVPRQSFCNL